MTDDEAFLVFCWEKIVREVGRCCDMRGSDLVYLVRTCLTQNSSLSSIRNMPQRRLLSSLSN